MFIFITIIAIVILQRLIEVIIAKRNEQILIRLGAYEVGASHYPYMIALHVSFFISIIAEFVFFNKSISPLFPYLFACFLLVQVLRFWCLRSLGIFWNTKIIVLPGSQVVKKGPYHYFRHPNYLVVCCEIFLLPVMFRAYVTAIIFTILNTIILSIRIPLEEKALLEASGHSDFIKSELPHK